jgi:hypothetical protein
VPNPPGIARTSIGSLHDSGSATRHDGEAGLAERVPHLARHFVVTMSFGESRRSEHRDARLVEVEAFEAVQEFQEEAHGAFEVGRAVTATRKKQLFSALDLLQERRAVLSFGAACHAHSPAWRLSVPYAPTPS